MISLKSQLAAHRAVMLQLIEERDKAFAKLDRRDVVISDLLTAIRITEWPWRAEAGWGVCEACDAKEKDGHQSGCLVGLAISAGEAAVPAAPTDASVATLVGRRDGSLSSAPSEPQLSLTEPAT